MNASLLERLDPSRVESLADRPLARLLCELWIDPDVREELHGSKPFIADRIRAFSARGYFTPRERQGILRNLYAPSFDIRRRVKRALRSRSETEIAPDG